MDIYLMFYYQATFNSLAHHIVKCHFYYQANTLIKF